MKKFDYIIVGAGFFGSVLAERLTNIKKKVLVIDKRDHIGGNCYTYNYKDTDINIHKYGSHIFHTSNKQIWDYINQFASFNNYRHKGLANFKDKIYSMPVNLLTFNQVYKKNFNPQQAKFFLEKENKNFKVDNNLESKAISLVGRKIYNKLIKGYTIKQWNKNPKELPASIINRLPVRYNYDDNYYHSYYQGIPKLGYTEIFKKLLSKSEVRLGVDYFDQYENLNSRGKRIIYTGAIDRYFDFKYGKLNWRSLDFKLKKLNISDFQGASIINYPDSKVPHTRIHEFKHLHPEKEPSDSTVIMNEYSILNNEDPYYPVRLIEDMNILQKYILEKNKEKNVFFGGRLAEYKYLDMHQVIGAALNLFKKIE